MVNTEKPVSANVRTLRLTLVALDCVFVAMQPILVHMSKDTNGKFSFNPVSVNLLIEVFKLIFATGTIFVTNESIKGQTLFILSPKLFLREAYHSRLLMMPACLYAINNYLKFLMQLHFDPTTTKMLGNLKIFMIALLMKVLLRRSFSMIQWEALCLLVAGISINQLPSCKGGGTNEGFTFLAVLYTFLSVTVPATASVYNELALKKRMDTSVHIQNFFLYFYGMMFNILGVFGVITFKGDKLNSLFVGHNAITLLLVTNNAIQGILSSFFYKFADTILKKYSSSLATLLTGLLSAVMFGHKLSLNFIIGVVIVLISMHQFFTFGNLTPQKNGSSTSLKVSPSLDHIDQVSNSSSGVFNGAPPPPIKQRYALPV
eukprot:g5247.t1